MWLLPSQIHRFVHLKQDHENEAGNTRENRGSWGSLDTNQVIIGAFPLQLYVNMIFPGPTFPAAFIIETWQKSNFLPVLWLTDKEMPVSMKSVNTVWQLTHRWQLTQSCHQMWKYTGQTEIFKSSLALNKLTWTFRNNKSPREQGVE